MKVLIVGCGLAGLSTAISLTSKIENVQIIIVERRSDLESRGATFGLQINGQNALKEIARNTNGDGESQVLSKLIQEGVHIPSSGGYMLPWWSVRDALLDEVKQMNDRITVHLGMSIDKVVEEEEGGLLEATFNDSDMVIHDIDLIVGADGVNSHIRTSVLQLQPARPTQTYVWRGSVDISTKEELKHFQDYPIAKFTKFGDAMIQTYFNFHSHLPGSMAYVFTVRANHLPEGITIDIGTTTPIDLIKAYMDQHDVDGHNNNREDNDDLKEAYELAMLAFTNTHQASDLTWSSEMAVVDLTNEEIGWGGRGRITLVGDAAHSLRPASGLGGSLAFEDAALLGRYLSKCSDSSRNDEEGGDPSVEGQLRAFEKVRLPRCKSISNDQSIRSELSYKVGFAEIPKWDQEYRDWINEGIDSPPEPPLSEMIVFTSAGLLS